MNSPEPILDIVRMISVITSVQIGWKQTAKLYKGLFTEPCPRCRGTGKVLCPYCRGTKLLQHVTPIFSRQLHRYIEPDDNKHVCPYCGDFSLFDDDFDGNKAHADYGMDEQGVIRNQTVIKKLDRISEKMKAAYRNVDVLPHRDPPLAGCITCPTCNDHPTVWRHTPNLLRFLGLDEPWDVKVAQHVGYHRPLRKVAPDQFFLEYPIQRQALPEERSQVEVLREMYQRDVKRDKELQESNEKALEEIKKQYQDSDEKFILNFIDIGEEERE